jgi:hypothetical protein
MLYAIVLYIYQQTNGPAIYPLSRKNIHRFRERGTIQGAEIWGSCRAKRKDIDRARCLRCATDSDG